MKQQATRLVATLPSISSISMLSMLRPHPLAITLVTKPRQPSPLAGRAKLELLAIWRVEDHGVLQSEKLKLARQVSVSEHPESSSTCPLKPPQTHLFQISLGDHRGSVIVRII